MGVAGGVIQCLIKYRQILYVDGVGVGLSVCLSEIIALKYGAECPQ